MPSPWRDRPIEESLRLFKEMSLGLHEEGFATLRSVQDTRRPKCLRSQVSQSRRRPSLMLV